MLVQDVEDLGRPHRVGSVVEGQRDRPVGGAAVAIPVDRIARAPEGGGVVTGDGMDLAAGQRVDSCRGAVRGRLDAHDAHERSRADHRGLGRRVVDPDRPRQTVLVADGRRLVDAAPRDRSPGGGQSERQEHEQFDPSPPAPRGIEEHVVMYGRAHEAKPISLPSVRNSVRSTRRQGSYASASPRPGHGRGLGHVTRPAALSPMPDAAPVTTATRPATLRSSFVRRGIRRTLAAGRTRPSGPPGDPAGVLDPRLEVGVLELVHRLELDVAGSVGVAQRRW